MHATRTVTLGTALAVLAFVSAVPFASANIDPSVIDVACPVLPLWDATWCWVGVTLNLANWAYEFVTCDVVGGPVCGLVICDVVSCSTVLA